MCSFEKKSMMGIIGVIIIVCILLISVLFPVVLSKYPCIWNDTFGAMYGVLSALFTGLAFAATIVTLLFHQQEIKEQRMISNLGFFEGHYIRMQQELKDYVNTIGILGVNSQKQPVTYLGKDAIRELSGRIDNTCQSEKVIMDHYVNKVLSIIEYVDQCQLVEDKIKKEYIREIMYRMEQYELNILSYYYNNYNKSESSQLEGLAAKYAEISSAIRSTGN